MILEHAIKILTANGFITEAQYTKKKGLTYKII